MPRIHFIATPRGNQVSRHAKMHLAAEFVRAHDFAVVTYSPVYGLELQPKSAEKRMLKKTIC